ncbi:amino acid adenylation domain-containing protein [Nannocystis bainbridge]|uniref:Amino acid adenylation domain-containing protein n=1 Tax=Nannocystis bainbridge TaxID=2995303 RepID=A0ABT5E5N2_9BACT|nr:amino acid adenylation domain-containing protein [Nannocystis bainbridge]MDC0721163.1 amino acid adenylation domain-containing protein [Nannocystis bainbridge]
MTQLLNELAQQNIRIAADGDDLTVRAPRGALTPWLREQLQQHKPAILTLLRRDIPAGDQPAIPRVTPDLAARHEPFPLTDIQQAYWVGRMSEFDQGDVSIHFYVEVDGQHLDLPRLETAWNRMVRRHDMLHSVVAADGRQRILEQVPDYHFVVADLRERSAAEVEAALAAVHDELSHQVLPNDRWPAFEIRASLLPGGVTRLHLSVDLVNMDGGSLMLLLDEWTRVYFDPHTSLEPLELSYRDYVLAELELRKTPAYQQSLAYWKQRVPQLPPAPELVTVGGERQRTRFVHKTAKIERAVWERLKAAATARDLTVSSVLAAAYAEVLAAWGKGPDFTLNVTLFNRLPVHPQVDAILGDFTSMILLGVEGSAHAEFEARARAIQQQLWHDLEHHEVSGIEVLRELARVRQQYGGAIMPIVFTNMLNLGAKGFAPLYTALERLGSVAFILTQTPQVWLDYQVHEDAEGLRLTWDAVEGLFPAGMVDDMLTAHCRLLRRLADDEQAWRGPLVLVSPDHVAMCEAANRTEAAVPEVLLHRLFEAQVPRRPDHPAVVAGGRTLTYAELHRRACQVGNRLRALGAVPDALVAIVMDKGWEQVVAALGIHMAGAAYVPIDPSVPPARLHHLLAHAEVKLVLTQSHLDARLAWPAGVQRLRIDGDDFLRDDDAPLVPAQRPGDLAYVLYTSGSTGQPKGVMIEQRSVVNRMLDVGQRAGVGPDDRCLALTALHHDLSVWDIFGVLAAGATIVVPDAAAVRDPASWTALMRRERVTLWNSVPAFLEMLVEHLEHAADDVPEALRWVILAGDWIPVGLPDRLRAHLPRVAMVASGGPTETTIWDIWYPIGAVDPAWRSIPYGRPMTGSRYHVLDPALRPCPAQVPGELYIGGVGLARGYWRDEARTAAAFVVHPVTGERLYRSGDLGRWLPDGNIEFLGRADNQVKVGGVRIELEEIEAELGRHPQVRGCAVVVKGEPGGARHLVAFVVPNETEADADTDADTEAPRPHGADPGLDAPAAKLEFKLRHLELRDDLADRPAVALPELAGDPLSDLVAARRSRRSFRPDPVPLTAIAGLLAGLRARRHDDLVRRGYPSAGSLYPVQTYMFVKPGRIDGLEGGAYHYDPEAHRLVRLGDDLPGPGMHAPVNRPAFTSAAFSLLLVGQLRAIEPLYGAQARDFCLLEAGYASQSLMLAAEQHGLGLCPIGGLDDAALRGPLALDDGHVVLHSHVGGLPDAAAAPPAGPLGPAGLRAHLRTRLPEALVPATYVLVDALPRTANGKLDRRALAARDVNDTAAPAAAASGLEERVAAIVAEVLQLPRIERDQNFFELGATSVHLVRIAGRLRTELGCQVTVTTLFRAATVRVLAGQLEVGAAEEAAAQLQQQAQGRVEARLAARGRRGRGGSDV